MQRLSSTLVLLLAVVGCSTFKHGSILEHDKAPTVQEAARFMERAEAELKALWIESDRTAWVSETYITEDTEILYANITEKVMEANERLVTEAQRYNGLKLPAELARKFYLLRFATVLPSPKDADERRELAGLSAELSAMYGKAKVCHIAGLTSYGDCLDINSVSKILAKDRDPKHLELAWEGWHDTAQPMRIRYERFVKLANDGARQVGFANLGEMWRSGYDMTPMQFEAEEERLWQQVRPLYESLHCYVRSKLADKYGEKVAPRKGPIPAHLLGNLWAQEWSNIYSLVEPYPGAVSLDVDKSLALQKYDAIKMTKTAEGFFTSLGMPALPSTFWTRSLFVKPRDRDVVCHASAWDIGMSGDPRIKMCIEITAEDLATLHHELGHVYYYAHYTQLPPLFQQGANDGFHEGIGDTLILSMTPSYLRSMGLLSDVPTNVKGEINSLMKRALEKVAFLPFGKLVDQWRWEVFDGRITPNNYNAAWWKLRREYQGIVPPVDRGENDFDPGAKYHIPANVPYARYFLAHILQFQFHRALCRVAKHQGPLHNCSIYGSKEAGKKLSDMLSLGASRPWPEALQVVTGERSLDATALLEYFAPLQRFLDEANAGEKCGW